MRYVTLYDILDMFLFGAVKLQSLRLFVNP